MKRIIKKAWFLYTLHDVQLCGCLLEIFIDRSLFFHWDLFMPKKLSLPRSRTIGTVKNWKNWQRWRKWPSAPTWELGKRWDAEEKRDFFPLERAGPARLGYNRGIPRPEERAEGESMMQALCTYDLCRAEGPHVNGLSAYLKLPLRSLTSPLEGTHVQGMSLRKEPCFLRGGGGGSPTWWTRMEFERTGKGRMERENSARRDCLRLPVFNIHCNTSSVEEEDRGKRGVSSPFFHWSSRIHYDDFFHVNNDYLS